MDERLTILELEYQLVVARIPAIESKIDGADAKLDTIIRHFDIKGDAR